MRGPGGHAHGQRAVQRLARGVEHEQLHRPADALGQGQGRLGVGVGRHHGEFLSAIARRDVRTAHRARQNGPHPAQHLVAHCVAVGVVDPLEVVHVQHEYRTGLPGADGHVHQARALAHQVAPVGQPGELVRHRRALQLGHRVVHLLLHGAEGVQQDLDLLGRSVVLDQGAGHVEIPVGHAFGVAGQLRQGPLHGARQAQQHRRQQQQRRQRPAQQHGQQHVIRLHGQGVVHLRDDQPVPALAPARRAQDLLSQIVRIRPIGRLAQHGVVKQPRLDLQGPDGRALDAAHGLQFVQVPGIGDHQPVLAHDVRLAVRPGGEAVQQVVDGRQEHGDQDDAAEAAVRERHGVGEDDDRPPGGPADDHPADVRAPGLGVQEVFAVAHVHPLRGVAVVDDPAVRPGQDHARDVRVRGLIQAEKILDVAHVPRARGFGLGQEGHVALPLAQPGFHELPLQARVLPQLGHAGVEHGAFDVDHQDARGQGHGQRDQEEGVESDPAPDGRRGEEFRHCCTSCFLCGARSGRGRRTDAVPDTIPKHAAGQSGIALCGAVGPAARKNAAARCPRPKSPV